VCQDHILAPKPIRQANKKTGQGVAAKLAEAETVLRGWVGATRVRLMGFDPGSRLSAITQRTQSFLEPQDYLS
jgi:hypothetical protein